MTGTQSAVNEKIGINLPASSGFDRKSHFLELDFLRGIAALGVIWYHLIERIGLPPLFSHGYLGVDFFFALSGFVIAHAYEKRIQERSISISEFIILRVIRLFPLVFIGILIGSLVELGRPGITNHWQHIQDLVLAGVLGSILVPILFSSSLDQATFPLNGPLWSLSAEFVSNIVFAYWAARSRSYLPIYIATMICLILMLQAIFSHGSANFGSLPSTFPLSFVRIGWSFGIGMIIHRNRKLNFKISFLIPLALLILAIASPVSQNYNAVYDGIVVLILFPAIIFMSKTCKISNLVRHWAAFSGSISYPIYIIHYPIVRVVCTKANQLNANVGLKILLVVLTTLLLVALSHCLLKFYDLPIRAYLKSLWTPFRIR